MSPGTVLVTAGGGGGVVVAAVALLPWLVLLPLLPASHCCFPLNQPINCFPSIPVLPAGLGVIKA